MNPPKARADEYAERVNKALSLLSRDMPPAEVAQQLARRYGVSERQGWRYVQAAAETRKPLAIPEPKVVFTVKLPEGLAHRVRAAARASGRTLSSLVTEALEEFLRQMRPGQRGGSTD